MERQKEKRREVSNKFVAEDGGSRHAKTQLRDREELQRVLVCWEVVTLSREALPVYHCIGYLHAFIFGTYMPVYWVPVNLSSRKRLYFGYLNV